GLATKKPRERGSTPGFQPRSRGLVLPGPGLTPGRRAPAALASGSRLNDGGRRMSASFTASPPAPASSPPRPRLHYGLGNVVLAAVARTAPLPGRTHGLGLITKPLTEEKGLGVDEEKFSDLNFAAVLLGSALCLPVGRLIDRLGSRVVLTG